MCAVKMAKHTLFALCGGIAPYTARRGMTQGCAACRNEGAAYAACTRAGVPQAELHLYAWSVRLCMIRIPGTKSYTGKAERTAHVVCSPGPHRDRGGHPEAMRKTDFKGDAGAKLHPLLRADEKVSRGMAQGDKDPFPGLHLPCQSGQGKAVLPAQESHGAHQADRHRRRSGIPHRGGDPLSPGVWER